MLQRVIEAAGLRSIVVAPPHSTSILVMLHGYAMEPEALVPFAHSMGQRTTYYFPQGPVTAISRGHAWWPIDNERRQAALQSGPGDLAGEYPVGRAEIRAHLCAFLDAVRQQVPGIPLVLGGFSQGGMLACDTVLNAQPELNGLALMSSSRIAWSEWVPRLAVLRSLPVFISHGRLDADLAFSAGEQLRDCLIGAGADVTWLPFDGGHEIPFIAWRQLRKFITKVRDLSPRNPIDCPIIKS